MVDSVFVICSCSGKDRLVGGGDRHFFVAQSANPTDAFSDQRSHQNHRYIYMYLQSAIILTSNYHRKLSLYYYVESTSSGSNVGFTFWVAIFDLTRSSVVNYRLYTLSDYIQICNIPTQEEELTPKITINRYQKKLIILMEYRPNINSKTIHICFFENDTRTEQNFNIRFTFILMNLSTSIQNILK